MSATVTPDRQRFRAVLAELADKAKAKLPDSNGRVEKAVALVLSGDIAYDPQTSTALVNSCSDATKVYRVRGKVCECPDASKAPQHLCKHVLATMFVIRIEQMLATEAPTPELLAAPRGPLGEAPSSVNLRVLLYGHECQLTLRDDQEDRLLQRLEDLLKNTNIRPLPAPRPTPRLGHWQKRR
jgi:hypothetical protein